MSKNILKEDIYNAMLIIDSEFDSNHSPLFKAFENLGKDYLTVDDGFSILMSKKKYINHFLKARACQKALQLLNEVFPCIKDKYEKIVGKKDADFYYSSPALNLLDEAYKRIS